MGVLMRRALLFGVCIRAADFRKLPNVRLGCSGSVRQTHVARESLEILGHHLGLNNHQYHFEVHF